MDVTNHDGPIAVFHVRGVWSSAHDPHPDARISIRDDRFSALPKTLPARGVIRIANRGERPRNTIAIRVRKGLPTAQAIKLVRDGRPQRAGTAHRLIGLVSGRARNYVEAELPRGRYVVVSFDGALTGEKPDPFRGVIGTTRVA